MLKKPLLVLLFCAFSALPAQAAPALSVLTYDVYAGGIHGMNATLTLNDETERYNVSLETATIGFLKKLAPWSGVFTTSGWLLPDRIYQPEQHISAATWKGETEKKEYKFNKNGDFLAYKVTEGDKDTTPANLDAALTPHGVKDVLSTTLEAMAKLDKGEKCAQDEIIFDGDRNFQMIFAPADGGALPKSDYNIYQGPAISCTIEVKPGAGKWHKKPRGWLSLQEQGRKSGTMPTIWFAQLAKDGRYLPVKVRVKTDYGTLFMHLTSYQAPDGAKQSVTIKNPE